MGPFLMALYGIAAYLFFAATFAYTAGFLGNFPLPKNIDSGPVIPVATSVAVDLMLLTLFAVQHSVMARAGFKRWWTRIVPEPVERSTYVLAATAALALLVWQWKPIPQPLVWDVQNTVAVTILQVLFFGGWVILLLASFLIDHFELFGLRQPFRHATGASTRSTEFRTPFLYRFVRHPIYLGLLISFWAAPRMSAGHLLVSIAASGYIFVGIFFEERDLVAQFGERYRRYRREVRMILPLPGGR
jgi:protein-S-isoprenylcysteine O-methyltransferase Ste14